MITVDKSATHICKRTHVLVNMQYKDIRLEKGQRVKLIQGSSLDATYFGMQGKFGLILFPSSLFKDFNTFKQGV